MKALKIILSLLLLTSRAHALGIGFNLQFEPRQLGKVAVCIYADRIATENRLADGGIVTNCFNASTTNMTGVVNQTTNARRPTYKLHNTAGGNAIGAGHNSIRFNGSSQQMYVTNLTLITDITAFMVVSNATSSHILIEHSADANANDGIYGTSSDTASWLATRSGSTHWAVGVTGYMLNKFLSWQFIYPSSGDATLSTNGTALANGTITGANVGNATATATLNLMGRANNSSLSGGDLWWQIIYNQQLSTDDQNRVLWWSRRVFHTY